MVLGLAPGHWSLAVRYPGAATGTQMVFVDSARSIDVVIELAPGAAIDGLVRNDKDEAVGAGTEVWAWPTRLLEVGNLLRLARKGQIDPRLSKTKTDDRGVFRLDGLEPHEPYRIAAIHGSSLSIQDLVVRAGGRADVRLVPVVGRVLSFRAQDGHPLPGPHVFVAGGGPRVSLSSGGKRLMLREFPELWLTPVGESLRGLPALAGSFAPEPVVFAQQGAVWGTDVVGRVQVRQPGFEAIDSRLTLKPLTPRVARTEVVLTRLGLEAPGSIEVGLAFAPAIAEALLKDPAPLGRVLLNGQDGDRQVLSIALPPYAALPVTITGIPAGRWVGRYVVGTPLVASSGSSSDPFARRRDLGLSSVAVAAGETSKLKLDLSSLSAIRPHLDVGPDDTWGGTASFIMEADDRNAFILSNALARRAPYVFLVYGRGVFRCRVQTFGKASREGSATGTISGPGQLLDLTIPFRISSSR